MLKVVLDTNVLVSALLKENSLPAFILALIRKKKLLLCLTEEIFKEYVDVLRREKFYQIEKESKPLLSALKKESLMVKPGSKIAVITDDPEDNKFLECAVEAKAVFLITGNTKHFPKSFHRTKIVNPRQFVEITLKSIILNKDN